MRPILFIKTSLLLLFAAITLNSHGQNHVTQTLKDSARILLTSTMSMDRITFDQYDYNPIVDLLQQALSLQNNDKEALYLLGYTYSYEHARDARYIPKMTEAKMQKSIKTFEKLYKIDPNYAEEGKLSVKTKLFSEWASLALAYFYKNEIREAKRILKSTKENGYISDYTITYAKELLRNCKHGSIVFSTGDLYTYGLLYVQEIEEYRQDIIVVDINLLGTEWYVDWLNRRHPNLFGLNGNKLAEIEYLEFNEKEYSIKNMTWNLEYSQPGYLMRDELLMLAILEQNQNLKDFYFTPGVVNNPLGLHDYLDKYHVNRRLLIGNNKPQRFKAYEKQVQRLVNNISILDTNNPDEKMTIDFSILGLVYNINYYKDLKENDKVKENQQLLKSILSSINYTFEDDFGNLIETALK